MRPQRETTDLEGVLVLGEGVGHGGGGGQHVPEVDGHAALPVQAGAHVHQALGGLPHLGRGVNERQIGRRWALTPCLSSQGPWMEGRMWQQPHVTSSRVVQLVKKFFF